MSRKSKEQQEQEALAQRRNLIDEFGRLEAELLPFRAKQRRLEELGRLIRSWYAAADPESTETARGVDFEVIIGPAAMQTHIAPIEKLFSVLGRVRFLKAATVTLKALEAHLDAADVASLTHKQRTGTRSLLVRKLRWLPEMPPPEFPSQAGTHFPN